MILSLIPQPLIGVERDAARPGRLGLGTSPSASSPRGDNWSARNIPGLRRLPALCLLVPRTAIFWFGSDVRMRSMRLAALGNALGLRRGIARNFVRRRDQPFGQGRASEIRTQIPFGEPPGSLRLPDNFGDDAHVEA